jgi:hypothetical protein
MTRKFGCTSAFDPKLTVATDRFAASQAAIALMDC